MLTALDPSLANLPKLRENLKNLAASIEKTDSPARDFKKIIHSLLLRTDEQLEALAAATGDSELPAMAYAARNLLELIVWTVYILKSNENAKRFAQDWVLDGIGFLEGLGAWTEAQGGDRGPSVKRRLEELRKCQTEWGLGERYLKVREIARELDMGDEYDNLNKVYSKLVHPTSWSILGMQHKLDPEGIKKVLLFRGVYYAGKVFCFINDHLSDHGLVPTT